MCRRSHDYIPAVAHGCVGASAKKRNAALILPQPPGMRVAMNVFFFPYFLFFSFLQKDKLHTFPPRRKKTTTLQWQWGGRGGGEGLYLQRHTARFAHSPRAPAKRRWRRMEYRRGAGGEGEAAVYIAVTRRYSKWRIQRATSPPRRGGKDY